MLGNLSVSLTGKTALVTGAGKGIGRGIARALAASGARVAAVSRTPADLESLKQEIGSGNCFIKPCDVSKVPEIKAMVDETLEWAGKIDILVNSAGINIQANSLEVTEEQWDRVINTNLKGAFFCSQAVAKSMVPHKTGKIITISSTMSVVGFYRRAAYCASKGGVSQFTKVMAVELAPHNITVNCIAPTFINTPFTEPMFKDQGFYDEVIRRIPMQRVGEIDDVIGAVLYLVSDAANLVTGANIMVDGGWTAW